MKQRVRIFLIFSIIIFKANTSKAFADSLKYYPVNNGLTISSDKHYLIDSKTKQPIFILATTAWNINALTYNEIDTLLESVVSNGFNSIMFCINFYPQADEPNIYGERPYIGLDKTELNPAYFSYCDYIIKHCTELGIYPMVYTMWSGKTTGTMNTYTIEQLYVLGKRIGERYRKNKNVILIAGGESSPPYVDTARVNAMGRGLRAGSLGNNLISVHPTSPHSNSEFYAQSDWLDFYMSQGKSNINGIGYDMTKAISKDYALSPVKPVMLGEHRYETGTEEDPLIQRRALYLSVFAGSFGYAYGHNALWQMTPHTAQPWMLKSWAPGVKDWKEALHTKAVQQLFYIKKLLYTYSYLERIPDQSIIISGLGDSISNQVRAMRDGTVEKNNASYIMLYISLSKEVIVKTSVINAKKLNVYWFNPTNGSIKMAEKNISNTGIYTFAKRNDGQDWVVVIQSTKLKSQLSHCY